MCRNGSVNVHGSDIIEVRYDDFRIVYQIRIAILIFNCVFFFQNRFDDEDEPIYVEYVVFDLPVTISQPT